MDRDTFVGREPELERLEHQLAAACAGSGSVVLVDAEPGMGKTALAHEMTRRTRARGVVATWGACLEGAGAPAYRPWSQILAQLGRRAEGLLGPETSGDGAGRFRLFDDLATALRDAAAPGGMLIVLDDLHWADIPSIRLLQVVAAQVDTSRLLLVGLYRGTEAYAHPELAALLPAVLRERGADQLALRGLAPGEVGELAARTLHRPPDEKLLRLLWERAEGNPLFVLELLRLAGTSGLAGHAVPHGVREVITRRLDRLAGATRVAIRQASVLGREIPLGVLGALVGCPPPRLLELLDEAVAAELMTTGGGHTARFTHALVQEVAYAELPSRERRELHRRAAGLIRSLDGEAGVDALAHHLRQAAPLGDAREGLDATLQAACRARGQLAYEHAAFQYREALALLPAVPAAPVRRQDLLLDLAHCEFRSGAVAAAWSACREAADLGRAEGDVTCVADAATVVRGLTHSALSEEIHQLCREGLAMLGDADPVRRARLLAQLAITASPFAGEADPSGSREALRIAEAGGDADTRFLALQARQSDLTNVGYVLERLAIGERAVQLGREAGRDEYLAWGRLWRMHAFAEMGRRAQLDAELADLAAVVRHMKEPLWTWRLALVHASLAGMEGRYSEARAFADEALRVGTRGGNETAEFLHLVFAANLAVRTGTGMDPVEAGVRRFVERGPFLARCWLAFLLAASGRLDEARRLWRSAVPHLDSLPRHAPEWLDATCGNAGVCLRLDDRATAPALYEALSPYAERHVMGRMDAPYGGPVALYLGALARMIGDRDAAEAHLRAALRASVAMSSPPFEAEAHVETARLAMGGESPAGRRDAGEHLEAALDIAGRLGLAPLSAEAAALLRRCRGGRESPLSGREEQVAALVADGLSNRQIAGRLHIAERTAENHVRNILDKLGFDSRTRIAAWYARRAVNH